MGKNLAYLEWKRRASYHRTVGATPGQDVFVRYMVFNLAPFIDWQVITSKK